MLLGDNSKNHNSIISGRNGSIGGTSIKIAIAARKGVGGGKTKRELTAQNKYISRTRAIKHTSYDGSGRSLRSSLCQNCQYQQRALSKTPGLKLGAISRGKLSQSSKFPGQDSIMFLEFQKKLKYIEFKQPRIQYSRTSQKQKEINARPNKV